MKKIAVVLSGCGVADGSEIYEAVLTLLALDKAGIKAVCVAPNKEQHDVINHYTGEPMVGEKRNVLVEAARVARREITPLDKVDVGSLDGAIFPGGYGAAKSLSSYGYEGSDFKVDPHVSAFIEKMHKAGKPLGFICISPVLAAKVLGNESVLLTIGNDKGVAADIESEGARHEDCPVTDIVVDKKLKVVSTPAYMDGKRISEVQVGIEKLVTEVLGM